MLIQLLTLRRVVATMLVLACVLGLLPALARAADPPSGSAAPIGLAFVPDDAVVVACVRVQKYLKDPAIAPVLPMLGQMIQDSIGLDPAQIDEVRVILAGIPGPDDAAPQPMVVVRTTAPHDFAKLIDKAVRNGEEASHLGKKYLKPGPGGGQPNLAAYRFDERTLVLASERDLQKLIAVGGKSTAPSWSDQWQKVAAGELAVMVDMSKLGPLASKGLDGPGGPPPEARQFIDMALPLIQNTQRIYLGGAKSTLTLSAVCPSATDAGKVQASLEQLLAVGRQALAAQKNNLQSLPPQQALAIGAMMPMAERIMASIKIAREDSSVTMTADVEAAASGGMLVALMLPAIQAGREAARRNNSLAKLKQLALAMHNYYSAHGRLPPAAVVGPDGKTVHSWRVALLPYLEEEALYKQYKFDEPWDSENNKQLIAKMPEAFRCPAADSDTNASYFVLTGKDTMFADKKGMSFAKVIDGTSKTILIVEAKRDIPWTKPEDIAYDANQPVPELGGFFHGGYCAVLADGSARFFDQSLDEKILRALITPAGREAVQIPGDVPPPPRPAPAARLRPAQPRPAPAADRAK